MYRVFSVCAHDSWYIQHKESKSKERGPCKFGVLNKSVVDSTLMIQDTSCLVISRYTS